MPLIDPNTPAGVQPNMPGASGYALAFSDEFTGSTLDPKWQVFNDFGNFAVPSNWDITGGKLRVWPDSGPNYNNWTMRSSGSPAFTNFTYGIWECSVKLCRGRGIFPAFWAYKHPDANPQAEIDIFEAYGYDGGGWNDGAANGWRPTNAAWTIWRDGGGPPTVQSGTLKLTDTGGPGSPGDLSAAQHIYTLKWEPDGLTFYFDGVQWGSKSGPIWTGGELNGTYGPCAVVLDLWFRLAGLPEPSAANTPSGPSNSMEWEYVRVWHLTGAVSASVTATFAANLSLAPPSSASLTGIVSFEVTGTGIQNVELYRTATADGTYARFTVNTAGTVASLNWNTASVTNGAVAVTIAAYDVPPGSAGNALTLLTARPYYIANGTSSDMPALTSFDYTF